MPENEKTRRFQRPQKQARTESHPHAASPERRRAAASKSRGVTIDPSGSALKIDISETSAGISSQGEVYFYSGPTFQVPMSDDERLREEVVAVGTLLRAAETCALDSKEKELRTHLVSMLAEFHRKLDHALQGTDVQALAAAGFDPTPGTRARDRTQQKYEELVANSFTTPQAARYLGLREASGLRQRLTRERPSLYGFKVGGDWRLPRFQFTKDRRVVPGFDVVAMALPAALHPVAVANWMHLPNPDLAVKGEDAEMVPLSPLQWLERGYSPEAVAQLAALL